ncbi:MAG: nuclear transport factor 2 family protein, partial [Armatimonadaceae bacterium]
EEAMALLADDCIYVLHIPESALPYGGETRGKAAIRATLLQMRRDFVDIVHRTTTLSFANELVRQRLEFIFRHRSSGQRLSGTGRLVWTVRDGLIVRCEEYHDGPRLAAFFNLFGREDGNNAT